MEDEGIEFPQQEYPTEDDTTIATAQKKKEVSY